MRCSSTFGFTLWVMVFMLLLTYQGYSQHCATIPSEENISYAKTLKPVATRELKVAKGIVDIPYQVFIMRRSDGSGGVSPSLIKSQLQLVNEIYIKANIRLVPAGDFRYVDDNDHYEYDIRKEDLLAGPNDMPNVLNIYAVDDIKGGYYGYTYHPAKSRKNRIFIAQSGFENNSTLPHELGHFFGLYHTHGKGLPDNSEPIDRSADLNNNGIIDCYETGDDLCDTPADPNLGLEEYRSYCLDNCEMNKKIPSRKGDYYAPHFTNLMCYNQHTKCRSEFTNEQLSRIAQTARGERKNLRRKYVHADRPVKGKINFNLRNGSPMPIDLDINLYQFRKAYRSGQSFGFEIENLSDQKLFMYIINMDARKNVQKVYPYAGDLPHILAGEKVNPLNGYIELDHVKGREYTCLLLTTSPIDVDVIAENMKTKKGTFTQRLYSVLGDVLLPLDHVKYAYGNAIEFEGSLASDEVLPIMIEMQHD